MTSEFTRGFRIVYPDGFTLDGAQFPSGRCVVDDEVSGLVEAAVDIDSLRIRRPGDRIEWASTAVEARVRTQVAAEIAEALWIEAQRVRAEDWPTKVGIEYVEGIEHAVGWIERYAAEPTGTPKEPTDG